MTRGPLATRSARAILLDPALLRYTVAHHPTCSRFDQDLVVVRLGWRRVPLCAGCVVFWPVLILGMPLVLYGALHTATPWLALMAGGFVLGSAQLLSYAGYATRRTMKFAVKAGLALGAAAVIAGLITAPGPVAVRLGAGLALVAITALVHTRRLKSLARICDACPWRRDWQHCPGFAPINDHTPGQTPNGWSGEPRMLPAAWPWDGPGGPRSTVRPGPIPDETPGQTALPDDEGRTGE